MDSHKYFHIDCRFIKKICSGGLLAVLISANPLYSQTPPPLENQVKAVFLFNFTRFMDWPSGAFNGPDAAFVIGIIGEDPFGSFLEETVAGEKFGSHPIVVQRFHNTKEITNCQILFINSNDAEWIKEILSSVSGKSILTVSNAAHFSELGGVMKFFTVDNKVRLLINTSAAKNAQINISSKLLGVAQIFNP